MAQGAGSTSLLIDQYTSVRDADILAEYRPQELIFRSPSLYLTAPLAKP
jgi:hypothetical protein